MSDPSAKKLGQAARSAVAEYLQVLRGGDSKAKKVTLYGEIHPAVKKSLDIIKKHFKSLCLEGQDILGTEEQQNKVQGENPGRLSSRCHSFLSLLFKILSMVANEEVRSDLKRRFSSAKNSVERWDLFEGVLLGQKQFKLSRLPDEMILQYAYPRLDINVSKGLNHLLKSPFCVHPKTGGSV